MSSRQGVTTFETALGPCAIAWNESGIRALQLSEGNRRATLRKLRVQVDDYPPAAPPGWVKQVLRRIQRHLKGIPQEFSDVRLDLSRLPPFSRTICEVARGIGPGRTASYGELARVAGRPKAARAVGQTMAHNCLPLLIPCHRILAAGGKPGGFSARGGLRTKARLLALEGVQLP